MLGNSITEKIHFEKTLRSVVIDLFENGWERSTRYLISTIARSFGRNIGFPHHQTNIYA